MTNKLTGTKPAITSVGILGGAAAFLASIAGVAQTLISDPTILAIIPSTVAPYVGVIGAVLAIYGRKNAKTKIEGIVQTPDGNSK